VRARGLLLILVLFAAPAAAKKDIEADALRAARHIGAWRFEEAKKIVDQMAVDAPTATETRYLRAELAFLDGEYQKALEHLQGLAGDALDGQVGSLRSLVASTIEATRGFTSQKSSGGHFVIHYRPGKDEAIVELTGEVLEAAQKALGEDFGYLPTAPVRVEILAAPADLARVSTLTEKEIETTGTIALCKYGKLMVVTPRATVFGYPWMDTMVHEYVHYLVSRVSHDKVPVWLHEGLARYQQVRWRGPATRPLSPLDEHLLAAALKKNDLIPFDDMHPSMAKLPSQKAAALAFAEVATMVAYVHQEGGYPALRKALASIKQGKSARKAVAEALDAKWPEVEKGWMQYLKAAKLRPQPALASRAGRQIRFKSGEGEDENLGTDDIANAKARKYARLGGILRVRGMSDAAAIEYEKALAAAGGSDPYVAGKLSRTYLDLKKYDRAIELARPLLTADEGDAAPATTLGLAYQATGRPREAAAAFEVALRVSPFDPAVRCGLAEVYDKLGDSARAKREARACERVAQAD
jgi:tetratricopeptide (TPR) repeat protein